MNNLNCGVRALLTSYPVTPKTSMGVEYSIDFYMERIDFIRPFVTKFVQVCEVCYISLNCHAW